MTQYWKLDNREAEGGAAALQEAAQLLQRGETVAFPTETVYGLGADATCSAAVERIFAAKGRPSDNPLIVHIADRAQLAALVEPEAVTAGHAQLMEAFWPGPLTIVLPVRTGSISPLVTAGLPTVGVRIPGHPVALRLLQAAGCPVAAPSANSSGRPSPTLAAHVLDDLAGRIGGIVDAGPTGVGVESTVVEMKDGELYVLRPGGVTAEQLQAALPQTRIHTAPAEHSVGAAEAPRAPGMKYTHYAPKGRMLLVQGGTPEQTAAWIQREADKAVLRGERTGVLTYEEHVGSYRADLVLACGRLDEPETIARGLYAALRRFDEARIQAIWAEACPESGMGAAVMNRLRKASGGEVVRI